MGVTVGKTTFRNFSRFHTGKYFTRFPVNHTCFNTVIVNKKLCQFVYSRFFQIVSFLVMSMLGAVISAKPAVFVCVSEGGSSGLTSDFGKCLQNCTLSQARTSEYPFRKHLRRVPYLFVLLKQGDYTDIGILLWLHKWTVPLRKELLS